MSKKNAGVTADTVKKIARLPAMSRLHIAPDRMPPLAEEMNGLLDWIEQMQEVDVEDVEPMTSAVDMDAPMREDKITDGGIRDKSFGPMLPRPRLVNFVVPRSVE